MLTTFNGHPALGLYLDAQRIVGYEYLKTALVSVLVADPSLTTEQKLGIRIASEKLRDYPGTSDDGVLIGILRFKYSDAGMSDDDVTPLTDGQREAIFGALMAICSQVLDAEAARLESVADTVVTLPTDWNAE